MRGVSRDSCEVRSANLSSPQPSLRKYLWHEVRASGRRATPRRPRHINSVRLRSKLRWTSPDRAPTFALRASAGRVRLLRAEFCLPSIERGHRVARGSRQRPTTTGLRPSRTVAMHGAAWQHRQTCDRLSPPLLEATADKSRPSTRICCASVGAARSLSASRKYVWHEPRASCGAEPRPAPRGGDAGAAAGAIAAGGTAVASARSTHHSRRVRERSARGSATGRGKASPYI